MSLEKSTMMLKEVILILSLSHSYAMDLCLQIQMLVQGCCIIYSVYWQPDSHLAGEERRWNCKMGSAEGVVFFPLQKCPFHQNVFFHCKNVLYIKMSKSKEKVQWRGDGAPRCHNHNDISMGLRLPQSIVQPALV